MLLTDALLHFARPDHVRRTRSAHRARGGVCACSHGLRGRMQGRRNALRKRRPRRPPPPVAADVDSSQQQQINSLHMRGTGQSSARRHRSRHSRVLLSSC